MDVRCVKCGSESTQRLQIVHESGLQSISTTSAIGGVGYAGGLAEGVAVVGTRGSQQSILSQRASPPTRRQISSGIGCLAIIGVLALVGGLSTKSGGWVLIGVILAAIVAAVAVSVTNYNNKIWPGLYSEWSKTFVCLRCGASFVPGSAAISGAAAPAIEQKPAIPALSTTASTPSLGATGFCTSCGAQFARTTDRFCGSCGTPIQAPAVDEPKRSGP